MNTYLFGISKFCEDAINSGAILLEHIKGLFDNDIKKRNVVKFGLPIEALVYKENIEVMITLSQWYYPEVIRQLLNIGYRKFSILKRESTGYEKKEYDYSNYNFLNDKDNLIVLYLQHKSYSGISAIEYMVNHNLIESSLCDRIRIISVDTDEGGKLYYLAMAKYVITERDRIQTCGKLIQLWHGFPLKTMGHMMTQYIAKDNKTENRWYSYDVIASYGQMYTNFMCACYGSTASQYTVLGMPRNDLLFVTDGKRNLRDVFPMSADKKIVMYMPTFRELDHAAHGYKQIDGDEEGYIFYWNDFSIKELEDFCRVNNIYFVFKLHPSDASKIKTWFVESDYIGILTDEMLGSECMYEYLNAADVLITDYSSVYFDYLLLDRPIVFTDKDIDSYMRHRGLMLEPLEFWRPGPNVHTMEALKQEIRNALCIDRYKENRKCLLPVVHKYRDGKSTQRLFDFMEKCHEKI